MNAQIKEIPILDHGFVRFIDCMGDDAAIVEAARVSYKSEGKTSDDDERLIKYLGDHQHTSPFEMCEMKFHMKVPLFVLRQLSRHRTGIPAYRTANINETSGRYREMEPEFYVPELENIKGPSLKNKQGSGEELAVYTKHVVRHLIENNNKSAYNFYKELLLLGVSRETARIVLPLNLYTEWYWKNDLSNILKLITLRDDPHAQWETQQVAKAIGHFVADRFPITWKFFNERRGVTNEI
jgi:thymidylate synthase (FAD)